MSKRRRSDYREPTAEHREWARLYRHGWSTRRIGARVGVSEKTVLKYLKRMGVRRRPQGLSRRRPWLHSAGYVMWGKAYVHRIVCEAWHGPPPTSKHQVNHKDGDKTNNHPDNLEWVTHRENLQHAFEIGLIPRGERHGQAKLTRKDVREVRRLAGQGWPQKRLAERFGVSTGCISAVVRRRSWKHVA